MSKKKPKLLIFITEDWYFWIHWVSLAKGARDSGYEVQIATRVTKHKALIEREGLKVIPLRLIRRSKNIFNELFSILEIIKIYRKERPDLVHHISVKPILYGSLAAKIAGVKKIVNTLPGLGVLFVNNDFRALMLRNIVKIAYFMAFFSKSSRVIFQNKEDLKLFVESKIVSSKKAILIRGVGVNIFKFKYTQEHSSTPIVVLASRMLWNKGVGELVEAARKLRKRSVECRIVLVGVPDPENPMSIDEDTLKSWNDEGAVEWWGYREDMPKVLSEANIVVLPTTYGEGLPTILLEAASCGRAIIATNVPGCKEIVRHEENGLLVPVGNSEFLIASLCLLIGDQDLRKRMGICGRKIAEEEFSVEKIVAETVLVYEGLLSR